MDIVDKRRIIEELAGEVGFDACGVAPARRIDGDAGYRRWLADHRHGTMSYLDRHRAQRGDASVLLPGARTVIVAALSYHQPNGEPAASENHRQDGGPCTSEKSPPPEGVAMYAWGDDYHRVVKDKLFALLDRMRARIDEPFDAKVGVDTVPIIEREYAMRAGLGWIGKNTLVLTQKLGSYFFLGEIVTTLPVALDAPATDHCGSCTRCLDACPTDAFVAPYRMDASRCISYLTIEHRADDIEKDLGRNMGGWIFGCDVCQQVCPFNRDAIPTHEPRFAPRGLRVDLDAIATADDQTIRSLTRGSAMRRAKPDMLRRNARIALSNRDRPPAPPSAACPPPGRSTGLDA